MAQVTIHIHAETAAPLLAAGDKGVRRLSDAVRDALRLLQAGGKDVAYAPLRLADGRGCAVSVTPRRFSVLVEIDAPGTLIPGRGVVTGPTRPGR